MVGSPEQPMLCPLLIGRDSSLGTLQRALDRARGGAGQVIALTGEAGIGKSRLVAEARSRSARSGFCVVEGHCFEPDRSLPYAAILDLLRARFTGWSPAAIGQELGPTASEIVKLLPELTPLLPDVAPSSPLEPEPEKRRLLQALGQYVAALASAHPTLLIVEDLHWADDTSLEALLYLARRTEGRPVLVLLTYRNDEPGSGLAHFLAELDRNRLATELRLSRLNTAEVDLMVRAIFGLPSSARPDFLGAIYALTEGNPFFIEEVLRSLVAAGDVFLTDGRWDRKPIDELHIPRSVQDAVRRRTARLSDGARRVLDLAAVAGRHFDFSLLEVLTRQPERELLDLIKELVAAQLVTEVADDKFAFRHALTRQSIYAELLTRERRVLHRQVAEALERLARDTPDAHLEDLSSHFHSAGVWEKALKYAQRAGERAQALFAPRAAIDHFSRAVEAASRLGSTPPAAVHRARGRAYDIVGEFDRARADQEEALRLAREAGDRPAEWRSLIDLGFLWMGRDHEQAGAFFRRALDVAGTLGEPALLAESLNRVGNWHVSADEPLEALRHHREALAIVEVADDRRGMAATLDLLGMAAHVGSDLVLSAAYYERAIALFRESGDRLGLASSLFTYQLLRRHSFYTDTMVRPRRHRPGHSRPKRRWKSPARSGGAPARRTHTSR